MNRADSETVVDLTSEAPLSAWQRDPRRTVLHDALAAKAPDLASHYWEAIRVLDDVANPRRQMIAGHLLRELQDKLPNYLNVAGANALKKNFAAWLRDAWGQLVVQTATHDGGRWSGEIDRPLRRFLKGLGSKIAEFFGPTQRVIHETTLGTLDPDLAQVPEQILSGVVDEWLMVRKVFVGVAHGSELPVAEFERYVLIFEALLGDRLIPRTFAKRDQLANLIREAEADAHS